MSSTMRIASHRSPLMVCPTANYLGFQVGSLQPYQLVDETLVQMCKVSFFLSTKFIVSLMIKDVLVLNVNVSGFGISSKYHLSRYSKGSFSIEKGTFLSRTWFQVTLIQNSCEVFYSLLITCYFLVVTGYFYALILTL